MVNIHGITEENMKVFMKMIKNSVMEYIHGQMVVFMMDNGLMVYSMDMVYTYQKIVKKENWAGGLMVTDLIG